MTTAPVDRDDVLRKSDLNSTHNRYDYFLAAPSDQELTIMWIIWAIIAIIAALICAILIISILSYKKTRKNPFDIYVVYLTLPDMLYSTFCAITCFMNYQVGHYYSSPMCEWQSFYCVFDFTANSWMNAVIARQLHSLIQKTHNRQHLEPIQIRSVTFHASCVYLYATFVASWTLYGFLPHRAMVSSGMACVPVEYSRTSTLFFWVVFTPAFVGIPLFYTLYVCFDVYWRGTLPRSGRTRVLAFYFLRLSSIFTLMWVPTVVMIFGISKGSIWMAWSGATISHLQGVATAAFAVTKPETRRAILRVLTCRLLLRRSKREVSGLSHKHRGTHFQPKDRTSTKSTHINSVSFLPSREPSYHSIPNFAELGLSGGDELEESSQFGITIKCLSPSQPSHPISSQNNSAIFEDNELGDCTNCRHGYRQREKLFSMLPSSTLVTSADEECKVSKEGSSLSGLLSKESLFVEPEVAIESITSFIRLKSLYDVEGSAQKDLNNHKLNTSDTSSRLDEEQPSGVGISAAR